MGPVTSAQLEAVDITMVVGFLAVIFLLIYIANQISKKK